MPSSAPRRGAKNIVLKSALGSPIKVAFRSSYDTGDWEPLTQDQGVKTTAVIDGTNGFLSIRQSLGTDGGYEYISTSITWMREQFDLKVCANDGDQNRLRVEIRVKDGQTATVENNERKSHVLDKDFQDIPLCTFQVERVRAVRLEICGRLRARDWDKNRVRTLLGGIKAGDTPNNQNPRDPDLVEWALAELERELDLETVARLAQLEHGITADREEK